MLDINNKIVVIKDNRRKKKMKKYEVKTQSETITCSSYEVMMTMFFNLRKAGVPALAIIK